MIDHNRRVQLADDLLRRFASALKGAQLYTATHPLVSRNTSAFTEALGVVIGHQRSLTLGVVGGEFVVGDVPVPKASGTMSDLLRRLQRAGVERIVIDREVTPEEIAGLVTALALIDRRLEGDAAPALPIFPHIQIGRIQVEQRIDMSLADTAAIRTMYNDAAKVAERLWEQTAHEGRPDPGAARGMVDTLAQAVAQNRTALIALTALKNYDNYTFTHMVNVSILTMAQGRALGVDGPLLREFGLAGLMHDIGKVRTPADILNKPEKLTDAEFAIMKRHVVDGAEILRRTPEVPPISGIVAFEHHLRKDGTGYPLGVVRLRLNLATVLCSISDVYDAMRSQRVYQHAFPTDRIKAVLEHNDGQQFDKHLVRRFVQLIGIYPPGTLVRLNTGEVAVVLRPYASDPHRPRVRVVMATGTNPTGNAHSGQSTVGGLSPFKPYDVNLWESAPGSQWPESIEMPLDPAEYGIDPLTLL
jgi:putative nucleotidyltransferase with HDIG domain